MQKTKNLFVRSLHELKNPRCLAVTALFIALNVTLDLLRIRIQLTPDLRIGIGFVLNASIGMLFGPTVGIMAGFSTDVLGYLVNSGGGAYFPGYTLTAMLAGLIYGLWLYPRKPGRLRSLGAKTCVNLFCNIGLNTIWASMTGGKALMVLLPARALKNLILLPFEIVLLYVVTNLVLKLYERAGLSAASEA